MAKKKIHIMTTAFRDGFQSVYGARVFTRDFLPAVKASVEAGIRHFEAGGGARFQAPFFYCNENAFDSMDQFRATVGPDVELQTLARGVNVVCLDSQPREIIRLHARLFKKHGITTIRNFDALNDVNNLVDSGRYIHEEGLKHEVSVTMMELPPGCEGAHTVEFYEKALRDILAAGIPFDSVCFKDASGTSVPSKVYETIRMARRVLPGDTKVVFHSHETAGVGTIGYVAAIEAGADQVDCSMAPCSGGTCQPDIAVLWHALRGKDFELDVDIDKVIKAEEVFKECMKDYFLPPEATMVEPMIPWAPMPGGALTANTQMLRDNGIMDKYDACIKAMGECVRRGGFGTSVTPVSQFYFQQAFNNVMFGPWKKIAEGYGKMVLGYFGRTPVEPDPEIIRISAEQLKLEPTTEKPVDIDERNPNKGVKAAMRMLTAANLPSTEENIFIAAACGDKGIAYLTGDAKTTVRKNIKSKDTPKAEADPGGYTVSVNGQTYSVVIKGSEAIVNGKAYQIGVRDGVEQAVPESKSGAATADATPVKAPMPGVVLRLVANEGEGVRTGDVLLVLEAMKMEIEIKAPSNGTVSSYAVKKGDQVQSGAVLAYLN
ncbi:MAG: biotin attachment protein [Kiritimatiellae bacterium]|nr:biotin attachment protein [Kiritimatiellia bacterium]